MNRFVFFAALLFPIGLYAGDPIPGIDITVNQSPGGIVGSGQTGDDGTFIFTELKPGPCTLTLSHGGKEVVLGTKPKERIIVLGSSKGSMKSLLFELPPDSNTATLSKKSDDRRQAKAPSAEAKKAKVTAARSEQSKSPASASYSSKSGANTDPDDDGDGVPTRSADGVVDCLQLIEISPMGKGQLQVKVTCQ